MLKLGGLAAQELAPRRHIEEQIPHLDAGPRRMRRRRRGSKLAIARFHAPRMSRRARSRYQRETRYRSDARQRLAAKPQGRNTFEVLKRSDLAGCMPRKRQPDLLRLDPDAIVAHPDERAAAPLEFDLDAQRPRIERVLHQLLDHGGGTLDDFTGRDLIDELIGKNLNRQGA